MFYLWVASKPARSLCAPLPLIFIIFDTRNIDNWVLTLLCLHTRNIDIRVYNDMRKHLVHANSRYWYSKTDTRNMDNRVLTLLCSHTWNIDIRVSNDMRTFGSCDNRYSKKRQLGFNPFVFAYSKHRHSGIMRHLVHANSRFWYSKMRQLGFNPFVFAYSKHRHSGI